MWLYVCIAVFAVLLLRKLYRGAIKIEDLHRRYVLITGRRMRCYYSAFLVFTFWLAFRRMRPWIWEDACGRTRQTSRFFLFRLSVERIEIFTSKSHVLGTIIKSLVKMCWIQGKMKENNSRLRKIYAKIVNPKCTVLLSAKLCLHSRAYRFLPPASTLNR